MKLALFSVATLLALFASVASASQALETVLVNVPDTMNAEEAQFLDECFKTAHQLVHGAPDNEVDSVDVQEQHFHKKQMKGALGNWGDWEFYSKNWLAGYVVINGECGSLCNPDDSDPPFLSSSSSSSSSATHLRSKKERKLSVTSPHQEFQAALLECLRDGASDFPFFAQLENVYVRPFDSASA